MATMTPDQIAQWAAAHEEARRSATQIEPPSKIDAKLALVIDKPLAGPDTTMLDVFSAAAYVVPALEESGIVAGVLNHPANGVAWLARCNGPLGAITCRFV